MPENKKITLRKKREFIVFLGLISLSLSLAAVFYGPNGKTPENIQAGTPLQEIEIELPKVIDKHGITAAMDWVRSSFAAESISMFQCHTLTHMIGHLALDYYKGDIEKALLNQPLNECEGGYVHGVEAQVADSQKDHRPALFQICTYIEKGPSISGCFHGAGHAFMTPKGTLEEALSLCSALTEGSNKDPNNCYTGVFSEYTNLIGGMDGHTGLPLTNGPPIQFTGPAIKFCSALEPKYQVACGLEVTGFGFGPGKSLEDIETSMHECIEPGYREELQIACLTSMAAVSTQHELPLRSIIQPPKFIFNAPEALRRAYIVGVSNETRAFIYNGQDKNWQGFCGFFPADADVAFCEGLFKT